MMNPATVRVQTSDLVDAFSGEHIFTFIHLPVQSGSDAILARMGRGYTVADFEEIVRSFRKTVSRYHGRNRYDRRILWRDTC